MLVIRHTILGQFVGESSFFSLKKPHFLSQ
jgi:hypothetical protein